jgi:hypothetical protein
MPCCGGIACAVTSENSAKEGCPTGAASCNACLSGVNCIPGGCGALLDGTESWELHLSAIGERPPSGMTGALVAAFAGGPSSPHLDPCKTKRDLWLCIRSQSHPEETCLSQVEACGNGSTGAARSNASVPIRSDELIQTGFDIYVRDGGPKGKALAIKIGAKYPGGIHRRVVCSGLRMNFAETDPIVYASFLLDVSSETTAGKVQQGTPGRPCNCTPGDPLCSCL